MALIYQQKLAEKQKRLDENRDEFRSKRNIATVLSIIGGINYFALLFLPKWTSLIFYKGQELEDKEMTILMAYAFYMATSLLYIIAFWVGACSNQQARTDEDFAIDSDDDGIDTSSDEEDEGRMATMED